MVNEWPPQGVQLNNTHRIKGPQAGYIGIYMYVISAGSSEKMVGFYLLLISLVINAVHGNGWCNQPAFQKYSIKSPLLFTCDNSDLKNEITALRQEFRQQSLIELAAIEQLSQQLQLQTCDLSPLLNEIAHLRDLVSVLASNETSESPKPLPSSNCGEIFTRNPQACSGLYQLNINGTIVNVTCDFSIKLPPLNSSRGWQEIANVNMSDPNHSFCPPPLRKSSGRCEKSTSSAGYESVYFSTNRVPFSKLCGRVVGYARGSPNSFICSEGDCGVDDVYVDGISITYENDSNREHIWTLSAAKKRGSSHCSCSNDEDYHSLSFVGSNYYCERSRNANSPLWDGIGCADVTDQDAACCDNPNLPWFCRDFDEPIVTDNIEVRVCTDEARSNEDIEFDLLKLYIQ